MFELIELKLPFDNWFKSLSTLFFSLNKLPNISVTRNNNDSAVLFPVLISPENEASLPCEYEMLSFPYTYATLIFLYKIEAKTLI